MSAALRAAAQDVVGAWEDHDRHSADHFGDLIRDLRAALAEALAEPVGEVYRAHYGGRVRSIGFNTIRLYEGANVTPGDKLYAAPQPAQQPLPDIESVSAEVHAAWMDSKRAQVATTRKAENGEELMVPYAELSEKAKELDRSTVRAVYAAINKTTPPKAQQTLTDEQINRHAIAAGECPPSSQVILVNSLRKLLAAAEKARRALSDLLMTRDPVVYADALRDLDSAIAKARGEQ